MSDTKPKSTTEYVSVRDGSRSLQIQVIRMRRNTCTITVKDDASLVLKCPVRFSSRQMEHFLDIKHDWIVKHYNEVRARIGEFQDVVDFKAVLVEGVKRPLVFCTMSAVFDDCVMACSREDIPNVYKKAFGQQIIDYAWELARELGVQPKSIAVRKYKTRWGCCDVDGNICINYLMAMVPKELLRLVIIHEFCHLRYMNHSASFHDVLDKYLPDNRRLQKQLNTYSFLLRLYC
ncbi:MAG: M48 family metallopeptidase [Clostridia bacterium]|nr:M48 family metallopeptidase [Clostridia bacterium]